MSEPLLRELRATKPTAPEPLRERIRAIAASEPERDTFPSRVRSRFQWRRPMVLAPATLIVAAVVAGGIQLSREGVGGAGEQAASGKPALTTQSFDTNLDRAATKESLPSVGAPVAGGAVAPTPGRLQRFEAELRLRVNDVEALSNATKRAQRIATSLGGHVGSLSYDAPASGVGTAQVTLRVPTSRIQSAIAQLSELGTILRQRYGIEDLQPQVDSLQAQIDDTQRQIARLVRQLRNPNLGDEERAVLQSRLAEARRTLTELQQGLKGTRAEGQLGTVFLTMTTERIEAAKGDDGALDAVADILRWEGMALLIVLVVVGPFLLLGLLIWYALRLRSRREEARLLAE